MAESGSTETTRDMAQDGADITNPAAMPAGGWGIRGWLSAMYTQGKASTVNSTETPLGIDGVFTGTAEDISNVCAIVVSVFTDKASATNGFNIEWSSDGVNWDGNDIYTIAASTMKQYTFFPAAKYYRIVYENGGTGQTVFRLQSILKQTNIISSSHRVADQISDQDDAVLGKSVITGEDDNGEFHNVKTTSDGNLTISDNSNGLAIAENSVTGKSFIHKFGNAPDFDKTDGFVTIWDGAEDGEAYEQMVYNYSTSADINYIVAEDNADTQNVEIQGLDANYDVVLQTITLSGNTPVELDTYLIRIFRMKNVGSVDFRDHVFCYVSGGTVTAGVPQVGADVRGVVHSDNNQTEMAVYTIPNGKTGYMRSWYASTAGAKKDSSHVIKLLARPFGQVFQLKHKSSIIESGVSYVQHRYVEPEIFAAKTDIEMRSDTDQDATSVAGGFDIVLVDD